jgi:hypothetical protein
LLPSPILPTTAKHTNSIHINDNNNKMASDLWFTSSTSTQLMGKATSSFSGLYKCSLDARTGTCNSPLLVADSWFHDGRTHKGVRLSSVQLDDSKETIYARTYDYTRNSWELLYATLETRLFRSYFRTQETVEWNDCGFKCCGNTGHTYLQTIPKSFVLDGDDVYVAWDGFYQNCSDPYSSSKGKLMWSIGISKLKKTKDCVMTSGDAQVDFAPCTDPVAIVYQNATGRSRVLSYGGLEVTRMDQGKLIFFLSVLHSQGIGEGEFTSEVWVAPSGARFSKSPGEVQAFGSMPVMSGSFNEYLDDAGTIRLNYDKHGRPRHLCRTVFEQGVFCVPINMDVTGKVYVTGVAREFVTPGQVQQTCLVPDPVLHPGIKSLPSLTTGLEVIWDQDGRPDMLFFGCFGEAGSWGNFTTVNSNGKMTQMIKGAYPGSILFGPALPYIPAPDVITPPPYRLPTRQEPPAEKSGMSGFFVFAILVGVVAAVFGLRNTVQRRRILRVYSRVYDLGGFSGTDEDREVESADLAASGAQSALLDSSCVELRTIAGTDESVVFDA